MNRLRMSLESLRHELTVIEQYLAELPADDFLGIQAIREAIGEGDYETAREWLSTAIEILAVCADPDVAQKIYHLRNELYWMLEADTISDYPGEVTEDAALTALPFLEKGRGLPTQETQYFGLGELFNFHTAQAKALMKARIEERIKELLK